MEILVKNKKVETIPCIWCGDKAIFKTTQLGYQEPDVFKIFYCHSCNTSFSIPRVNSDIVYELIYRNIENIRGYRRYLSYQKEILNVLKPIKYLANLEPSYWGPIFALQKVLKIDKKSRILEVGSGLGYFTYALNKAGYQIQGLDVSQAAVNDANEKFGNLYICDDIFQFALKNSDCYDVVIMTEVVEHLNDPKSFIISTKQLLKKDGVCIFTTPNKSFYPNDVAWFSDAPPIHCWWFSEKSFEYLANQNNMEIKFIDFKKYYYKYPELFRIKDLNNLGCSVFDKSGNLITNDKSQSTNRKVPKWIKDVKFYKLVRDLILQIKYPGMYIKGDSRSNVLCAILKMK
ncbi:MAG: class I SAM-dependent methyltransferase [Paludibacter sp.]